MLDLSFALVIIGHGIGQSRKNISAATKPHGELTMRHPSSRTATGYVICSWTKALPTASLDDGLRPWLLQEACQAGGIPLTLNMREGYDHSYLFISTFMPDHLRWHSDRLR